MPLLLGGQASADLPSDIVTSLGIPPLGDWRQTQNTAEKNPGKPFTVIGERILGRFRDVRHHPNIILPALVEIVPYEGGNIYVAGCDFRVRDIPALSGMRAPNIQIGPLPC